MAKKPNIDPFIGGGAILIVAQTLALFMAQREKEYLEINQIAPPELSLELPLIYFFGGLAVLSIILLLSPLKVLKIALKVLFLLVFAWGMFIALVFSLPAAAAAPGGARTRPGTRRTRTGASGGFGMPTS